MGQNLNKLIDPVIWITDGMYTSQEFKLFDDVGQVYELQLACMEFFRFKDNAGEFLKRTAYFESINGKKTFHYYLANIRGKGQIGHTNQYLTHWFYPYKGKFHGQMIKAIINFIGAKEGDIILDPFLGSGTTLIETVTLGLQGIGIEINPALCIVSQIKLDSLNINYPEFEASFNESILLKVFDYFDKIRNQLSLGKKGWKISQEGIDARNILNELWEEYFPNSFIKDYPFEWRNVLLLVYLHALSDYTYLKGTSKEKTLKEFFFTNFFEYSQTIKGCYYTFKKLKLKCGQYKVLLGNALNLPPNIKVKGIVTSPPYSIALNYIKNDLHLLNYLGIDTTALQNHMIGLKGKNSEKVIFYEEDIKKSIQGMHKILQPGGWAVIVLGDVVVNQKRTNFCKKILEWAPEIGFSESFAINRPILGGFARLRYEYLLFLKK